MHGGNRTGVPCVSRHAQIRDATSASHSQTPKNRSYRTNQIRYPASAGKHFSRGNESRPMASSDQRPSNTSRRFKWLAAAIVVVIAAYTAAWYYGAGVVLDRVNSGIASLNSDGRRV